MWRLGFVVALAACDATSGVQINVGPFANVTEVRAFVSTTTPTPIAPASPLSIPGEAGLIGNYFARDPNQAEEIVQVGANQTAQFVYTGSGTISAFIAVGYDHGVPIAVASHFAITLPGNHFDIYNLPLNTATLPDHASTLQLELWDPSADTAALHAACVGVQDTTPTADAKFPRAYIVNPGDPDCDGVTGSQECPGDDLIYFGEQPLQREQRDQLRCALETPGTQCMLGGPPCIDGPGLADPNLCVAAPYCASQDVCACSPPSLDCAAGPSAVGNFATGVKCVIGGTLNAMLPPSIDLCPPPSPLTVDLSPVLPAGVRCSNAGVYDPMNRKFTDQTGPFTQIEVDDTCTLTVAFASNFPGPLTSAPIANGLFVVELDKGGVRNNGLALPIELVTTSGGCGTAPSCQLIVDAADTTRLPTCTKAPAL